MKFIWLVVIVLAFSCERKPHKTTWEGIPSGVSVNCGAIRDSFEMTCVAGGRTYTCVRENPAGCTVDQTIHCGVLGAPVPEPDPPQYVPPPDPPPPVTTDVPGTSSGFGWW